MLSMSEVGTKHEAKLTIMSANSRGIGTKPDYSPKRHDHTIKGHALIRACPTPLSDYSSDMLNPKPSTSTPMASMTLSSAQISQYNTERFPRPQYR